ncbi:TetR/AcrR family transcriptional regulator [Nocardia speluncae]|uniref:TetR/AcrR family transcriptional regulator n=1 Tax=Nocardia speluncae TaxID=419477 RepID=A0A846X8E7_9NOCA|nr:TetR/AcrR family transcriptional regulator [Nocardia speluncae]NKY32232.1 TetR/AcrR family transcriptional regulator [Nocardia speluncae]
MSDASGARDERITAATLELLRTKGPRAVTVEAVAALSGVAKTTIYRRYSNRRDMLTASLSSVAEPEPLADTATLPIVTQWVAEQSRYVIDASIGAGGLAALLTDEDPEFTTLIRALLVEHRRRLAEALSRALTAERPRSELDVETVLDMIVGAYLAENARSGTARDDWTERVLSVIDAALGSGQQDRHRTSRSA